MTGCALRRRLKTTRPGLAASPNASAAVRTHHFASRSTAATVIVNTPVSIVSFRCGR
jgi:hypothetical protein